MSHGSVSDEALFQRFQEGESRALAVLVERHQTSLYNFALRHVRHAQTAEEIVQEAFVRVVIGARDFAQRSKFSTWVFTIVRNLCIDELRRRTHRKHASLDQARGTTDEDEGPTLGEQTKDPRADVERSATSDELQERIQRAVDDLPEEQREVFLLREVANMPFKEIAEMTQTPENTVKSRMRYALERLQDALRDYEEHARALR
jgi:RNA polymerase sigma-70 factor (ECF subfamily)